MSLLREPLIWFLVMAITSLVITLLLFRLIKSTARVGQKTSSFKAPKLGKVKPDGSYRMKTREYLLTGGVAGFLFIFFISWYTFSPMLKVPVGELAPATIPDGFSPYSESAFAIALPTYSNHPAERREIKFNNQDGDPILTVSVMNNVPADRFSSFNAEEAFSDKFLQGFNKLMPAFQMIGSIQPAPVQGRKGFMIPVKMTIPDDPLFENERGKSENGVMHFLLDERSRRIFVFYYSDNEVGKKIMSTINLPNL